MYTFAPLADIPVDHGGMFIACMTILGVLAVNLIVERETFFFYFFVSTIIFGVTYGASYHWTDQTPKTFVNEKVTGELVGFVAEGYNETRRSGKTTTHVDVHEQYVVYKVGEQRVLLRAGLGQTYPERVTLYKN